MKGMRLWPVGDDFNVAHFPNSLAYQRVYRPKDGDPYTKDRFVFQAPLEVTEHYFVDGTDYWRVLVDGRALDLLPFQGLTQALRKTGHVIGRMHLDDCVGAVLANESPPVKEAFATYGVFEKEDRLELCENPIPVKPLQMVAWDRMEPFISYTPSKADLEAYVDLQNFWNPYEILTPLGLGLAAPFAYLLRGHNVMFPHYFAWSPEPDLGKSVSALACSRSLFATESASGSAIASTRNDFRLIANLDSACLPLTVDEGEEIPRSLFPTLKESAERQEVSQRGRQDQTVEHFLSRRVLLITGNNQPIRMESVLKRFLIPRFDSSARVQRADKNRRRELDTLFRHLKPVGFQLIRWAVSRWPTIRDLLDEFRAWENTIDGTRDWHSSKRPQAWACVYLGLQILEEGCEKLHVDWSAPSITDFLQRVVEPVETATWGMERRPLERFLSWFDMWRVRNVQRVAEVGEGTVYTVDSIRGYGEIFDETTLSVPTERMGDLVTRSREFRMWRVRSSLLDEYNRYVDPAARIANKAELSRMTADHLGIPYEMVLERDGAKVVRLGGKPHRVGFVPQSLETEEAD